MINLQIAGIIAARHGPQLLEYRCKDGNRLMQGRLRVIGGELIVGAVGDRFVAHHVRLGQLKDMVGVFLLDVYRNDLHIATRPGQPGLAEFHRLDVVGNLGSDPHQFDNGDVVFPVAVDYSLEGERRMVWISVFVAAGELAENCVHWLLKKDLVGATGYLRTENGGPPMGNGQLQYQMDAVEIEFFWRGKREAGA